MSTSDVLTVGGPKSFHADVAKALGVKPDEVARAATTQEADALVLGADSLRVVVISPEVPEDEALDIACSVVAGRPATAVILARKGDMNGLLASAMRIGVRDVVDLSDGTEELGLAIQRGLTWASNLHASNPDRSHSLPVERGLVVSIFASKGGTGKTFLACNLAAALAARSGKDTALVDLDVDLGDVFSYFGSEPKGSLHDLMTLGPDAEKHALVKGAAEFAPHLWAFGAPNDLAAGHPYSQELVTGFIDALAVNFSYTVIDATAEYSDLALAAFDASDTICVVTGLDVVGIKHLARAIQTLVSIGVPREKCRIVLNRADSKVGLEAKDVEAVLETPVDAAIPSSRLVPMSLNKGVPIYLEDPQSAVSKSIGALADKLIGGSASSDQAKARRKLFSRRSS